LGLLGAIHIGRHGPPARKSNDARGDENLLHGLLLCYPYLLSLLSTTHRAVEQAYCFFARRSRISISKTTSSGLGFSGWGVRFRRLICFTRRKITNPTITRLMSVLMNFP